MKVWNSCCVSLAAEWPRSCVTYLVLEILLVAEGMVRAGREQEPGTIHWVSDGSEARQEPTLTEQCIIAPWARRTAVTLLCLDPLLAL